MSWMCITLQTNMQSRTVQFQLNQSVLLHVTSTYHTWLNAICLFFIIPFIYCSSEILLRYTHPIREKRIIEIVRCVKCDYIREWLWMDRTAPSTFKYFPYQSWYIHKILLWFTIVKLSFFFSFIPFIEFSTINTMQYLWMHSYQHVRESLSSATKISLDCDQENSIAGRQS